MIFSNLLANVQAVETAPSLQTLYHCSCSACAGSSGSADSGQGAALPGQNAAAVPSAGSINASAALISGTRWDTGGGKTVITYSFANAASQYQEGQFSASLAAFSAADQATTRTILKSIEAVCNVQFVEVADNGADAGVIRYAYSAYPNSMGYAGYAFFPDGGDTGGNVWIGKAQAGAEWDYYRPNLILHETLHAMGLKHPFEGGAVLSTEANIIPNTVMSYSPSVGAQSGSLGRYPAEPMLLDIVALQELYGAASNNGGNTTYNLADGSFRNFRALWDSDGVDTLDASGCAKAVTLDLTPGTKSDVGASIMAFAYIGTGAARTFTSSAYTDTLGIAAGTVIENATGSAFDDMLIGNSAANVLNGGAGDDLLIGRGGDDIILGGAGLDTAGYAGTLANFKIERQGEQFRVTDRAGGQGSDMLSGVEKLLFEDMSVDLRVGDVAATVNDARLKAVVELYVGFFNRVPDAEGLSYWLGQMNGGMTTGAVAESFYQSALHFSSLTGYSSGMSNRDFVQVIYKNVLGRANADAEGLNYWSNALDNGSQTRGSLLESVLNSAHTFKGNAQYGWVADLLTNKFTVGKAFAVDMGLTFNTADQSITKGMEIAAAVTPVDISEALRLIGVTQQDVALG